MFRFIKVQLISVKQSIVSGDFTAKLSELQLLPLYFKQPALMMWSGFWWDREHVNESENAADAATAWISWKIYHNE